MVKATSRRGQMKVVLREVRALLTESATQARCRAVDKIDVFKSDDKRWNECGYAEGMRDGVIAVLDYMRGGKVTTLCAALGVSPNEFDKFVAPKLG